VALAVAAKSKKPSRPVVQIQHRHGYAYAGRVFRAHSVRADARARGSNPDRAVEVAATLGHPLHELVALPAATCPPPDRALEPGMVVRFDGRLFEISADAGDSLRLDPQ